MSKKKNAELSRMWGFAGKRHWLTIASCILAGISTVLSIIPFVCIWFVIRDILYAMKKGDLSLAASSGHYAWLAVAFSLLSILLYFVALCCSHLAAFRTATNMKKEAMHHIVTLPLGYFSQNASGRLRKIIDDNAGLTEGFLAHQLPDLTGAVVMPVAVISLLFVFDWRLGICCLIPLAISVFFLKKMMGGDNADFMSGYMTALENMNKEAVEFVRGIPVVKVFQQTIYSFKNFHAAIEEYKKYASGYAICCRIPLTGFNITLNGTFILLIPTALMLFSAASGQADRQKLFLDFLFYSLFTPVCTTMMNRIMFASEQLMAAKSAVSRIEAILQEKPLKESNTQKQPKDPLSGAMANMAELFGVNLQVKRLKEIQEYPLENGQTEYHTKGYDVIFDHVKFSYETGKTVLKDVSFTAKQGQVTALVGPSGGGKSTIAKLAAKFYDVDGGKITLGGADIAKIDPVALMKDFSIVFQDVVLFNNTIMENIRVGRKGASDEDVIAAAKAAKCHDFIEKLPQGYQTVIGENGSTLSGGECQRLSIARALLKDAPVILLDEATASLDVDSETQIQEAISELVSGKTVLVIAHRMRTIEAADQIVVLDKGVVAEKGNHDTLMKKNGLYRKLVDLQTEAANWKLSV